MGAAALFFHYANARKAPTHIYLFASVVVSAICMLLLNVGWIGLVIGQAALFLAALLYQQQKKK